METHIIKANYSPKSRIPDSTFWVNLVSNTAKQWTDTVLFCHILPQIFSSIGNPDILWCSTYTKLLTIIKTVLPKRKKIHMGPCRLPVAKCVWNLKKNYYNLLTFVILNICNTCYVIVLAAKLWGWFSESMTKRIKHSSARKCISLAKQFGRQIFHITTSLFLYLLSFTLLLAFSLSFTLLLAFFFIFYLLHYY